MAEQTGWTTFKAELRNAKRVVRDIYGKETKNADIMNHKLDACETVGELYQVLAWGRVNLL